MWYGCTFRGASLLFVASAPPTNRFGQPASVGVSSRNVQLCVPVTPHTTHCTTAQNSVWCRVGATRRCRRASCPAHEASSCPLQTSLEVTWTRDSALGQRRAATWKRLFVPCASPLHIKCSPALLTGLHLPGTSMLFVASYPQQTMLSRTCVAVLHSTVFVPALEAAGHGQRHECRRHRLSLVVTAQLVPAVACTMLHGKVHTRRLQVQY